MTAKLPRNNAEPFVVRAPGRLGGRFLPILLVAGVSLVAVNTRAASLREREQEIAERSEKKKKDKEESSAKSSAAVPSSLGSGTYPSFSGDDTFFGSFWMWVIAAPFRYNPWEPRVAMRPDVAEEGWDDGEGFGGHWHEWGEQTIPYARVDYNFQFIDTADSVHDVRFELGYRLFGFLGRMTRYTEPDGFTLDLNQYYGMFRVGGADLNLIPGAFELGIGVGMVSHAGDSRDTSAAFTLPLKYYPIDYFGIEFRPAWYRWQEIMIGDYDISASLGGRFVQMRCGYRWIWDDGKVDVQSGTYVGVSVSL
ncbi:hypothetical protein [Pontiella sp.]|uniref:hypothetical protein n=1 Tax=Pontiella sp. TaxID=2837462 RepID=UPI0035625219